MEITTPFLVLIPIVLGLVQVGKLSGLDNRWAPALSILLSILIAVFLIGGFNTNSILEGIIAGLSACGLWSGTKTTVGN